MLLQYQLVFNWLNKSLLFHSRMDHTSQLRRLSPSTPPLSTGWRAVASPQSPSLPSRTNTTPSSSSWLLRGSRKHTGNSHLQVEGLGKISCQLYWFFVWRCCGILDWTSESWSEGCGFKSRQRTYCALLSFSKTIHSHCCSQPRSSKWVPRRN